MPDSYELDIKYPEFLAKSNCSLAYRYVVIYRARGMVDRWPSIGYCSPRQEHLYDASTALMDHIFWP